MSKKRNLFEELASGIEAIGSHREGKITLRTHVVADRPPPQVDADLIRDTRRRLKLSRAVFARSLRVSARTLENWEQGRAQPNAQAAALIMMVRKYPDTLERLGSI
ncbi:MAG: helix-turn-helix domain-containing protein [Gammaproteobacteria bacterium]|nr:helix-turn-helix domain-containing protein [Gammaproteobacteria bacterium]